MPYIAYYINIEDNQIVFMNSFAYHYLGRYLFKNLCDFSITPIHDDLENNEGKNWYTLCIENIENFDERYQKYREFDHFCVEFSKEFSKCIPIIKEVIKENKEDCNNYTNFGVHKS